MDFLARLLLRFYLRRLPPDGADVLGSDSNYVLVRFQLEAGRWGEQLRVAHAFDPDVPGQDDGGGHDRSRERPPAHLVHARHPLDAVLPPAPLVAEGILEAETTAERRHGQR